MIAWKGGKIELQVGRGVEEELEIAQGIWETVNRSVELSVKCGQNYF